MRNNHIDPADLINENNPNLWDFEILDGVSFMNCNRIHPLKQKEIQKLVMCDIRYFRMARHHFISAKEALKCFS